MRNCALLFSGFLRFGRLRSIQYVGSWTEIPRKAAFQPKGIHMKHAISTYWPIAILLPILLAFYLHTGEGRIAAARHQEADVASVSAELARAISLGLVDDDRETPVESVRKAL
jgi:hypothetical protein